MSNIKERPTTIQILSSVFIGKQGITVRT